MKKSILAISLLASTAVLAISLSWESPTEREDGTPLGLSEIAGFNVQCGTTIGVYPDTVYVPGAALPTTTFNDLILPNGTHYCVVTTVDIDLRESAYSNMVTLNVNEQALPKPPFIPVGTVIEVLSTR